MREKLIELIGHVQYLGGLELALADHLISNGVTIPVRCKECKKWQRHTLVDRERGDCRRYQTTKHESGFCDKGERRIDETG